MAEISTRERFKLAARLEEALATRRIHFQIDNGESKSGWIATDSQAEEDNLHDGQRKDEEHDADISPHSQEVLLQEGSSLAACCELNGGDEIKIKTLINQCQKQENFDLVQ